MEVTINWKWTAEVPNEINLSLFPVSGFVLGKNLRFATIYISLETNLRFRGCEVKYWNLPFTVEDFHEFQKVRCIGSETKYLTLLSLWLLMRLINQGIDKILSVTAPKFI